ncbi:VOC family protein [Nocardioides plantarum]|uniref:Putative pterin-4-alpha-carbinolamine dehydratase n=1 Tax=Nocardioides plantarum TaxID=29299 RepID=A0ABV5K6C0_9ACTN|nr:VOC family protein [Nocardioides plantarum]
MTDDHDQTDDQADDRRTLGPADVASELLDDWRYLMGALHARFETGDFATGLRLVADIGGSAEAAGHHPDLDLRYPFVTVRLTSHDVGGVTLRDVRLAREITDHAGRLGATPRPEEVRVVEWALDTRAHADVAAFWAAVLGRPVPEGDDDALADPDGTGLGVWFQEAPDATSTVDNPPEQRWHVDVSVPSEVAERRVQEVVAAGGTLISDARKPSFWVLADAHGNQACICTSIGSTEEVPVDRTGDGTDS